MSSVPPLPLSAPPHEADAIEAGAMPHPAIVESLVADVVREYPHGGWQHEPAIRRGIELGWRGRHELQRYRDEHAK